MTDQDLRHDAVVIDRVVDAPMELVWKMWTVPEHFQAWYGPDGASIPVADMDVRIGGTRTVAMEMQTPDGPMRMWFTGEYLEVVDPRLLVYTEAMADPDGNVLSAADAGMPDGHPTMTEVRVQLTDLGGRTGMTLTHVGVPAGSPGAAGWQMALDKLAAYLPSLGLRDPRGGDHEA